MGFLRLFRKLGTIHTTVIVRVRHRDGRHAAELLDGGDGRVVQRRDAVPQHVPRWRADEERPLTDANKTLDQLRATSGLAGASLDALFAHFTGEAAEGTNAYQGTSDVRREGARLG